MENKDFDIMLDDYIAFQVELKLTELRLQDSQKKIDEIQSDIDKYSMVALYVHIVGDLYAKKLDAEVEHERLEKYFAQLKAREKGFEGRKKDVIEDTFGPQMS